jgi:hypothetical protein
MIRVLLAVLVMFFVPFFAYAAYTFVRRRGELKGNLLDGAPINWLALAGTILAIATLARLVSLDILEYEQGQRSITEAPGNKTPGRSP